MSNILHAVSIVTKTQAICDNSLIQRARLGWQLFNPLSWNVINAAKSVATITADADPSFIDMLKIKLSTMRHINRLVGGSEIGIGDVRRCLGIDGKSEPTEEECKAQARTEVKIEVRRGKLSTANVAARYTELWMLKFEAIKAEKRRLQVLADDIHGLCNSSDVELLTEGVDATHTAGEHDDAKVADLAQYGWVIEALLEKCCEPIVQAKHELRRVMDRSMRSSVLADGEALMQVIDSTAAELGINWQKLDAEAAKVDSACSAVDTAEADIHALCDDAPTPATATDNVPTPTQEAKKLTRSKTQVDWEKANGEAAKAKAAEDAKIAAKKAAKAAKAKATREAKKAQPTATEAFNAAMQHPKAVAARKELDKTAPTSVKSFAELPQLM